MTAAVPTDLTATVPTDRPELTATVPTDRPDLTATVPTDRPDRPQHFGDGQPAMEREGIFEKELPKGVFFCG
jgi:hypothetical protein